MANNNFQQWQQQQNFMQNIINRNTTNQNSALPQQINSFNPERNMGQYQQRQQQIEQNQRQVLKATNKGETYIISYSLHPFHRVKGADSPQTG